MPFPPAGVRPGEGPGTIGRGAGRLLIGVCHLEPLPGAPRYAGAVDDVIARACEDARVLADGGVDLVLVENFGDAPFYPGRVPAETVAAMTRAVVEVGRTCPVGVGVNVLRNDPQSALGICAATGASFLRVNVHVSSMVTDQGVIEGRAAWTVRERARLAPGVTLMADVRVKHATPLGREGTVADEARDVVERGLADAVIVTGDATGDPPTAEEVAAVREAIGATPLLIGSGLDPTNAATLLAQADGAIVGTSLKRDGRVSEPVELERVRRMRALIDAVGA